MSLGRLLATGKTLDGASVKPQWHPKNKYVSLPKFISPRNPFTTESSAEATAPVAPVASVAATAVKAVTPPVPPAALKPAVAATRRDPGWPQKLAARLPRPAGAGQWLVTLGRKLNPLPRLKRSPKAARTAASPFSQPAVQTELSLEKVRVVRNSLEESEAAKPLTPPLPGAAKVALVGKAMDRISSRFFGSAAD